MFINSFHKEVTTFRQSIFLMFTFLVFITIGNIPLIYFVDYYGVQSNNPISTLKEVIGLDYLFIMLMIPFILGCVFIVLFSYLAVKERFKELVSLRPKIDFKRIIFSFFVWFLVLVLFTTVDFLTTKNIHFNFRLIPFIKTFFLALTLLAIQVLFEELLFRSIMFKLFGRIFKNGFVAVLLTGLLFGLMHGSNPEITKIGSHVIWYYIITGFFLGLIVLLDDGLELSLGYHFSNNFFAAVVLTNDWQAFQTDALFIDYSEPLFGWQNVLTLLIIQPLLLYVFSKKYKWMNWKERLFKRI